MGQLTREQIEAYANSLDITILLADGYDEAFIGLVWRMGTPIAVYDRDKCIEILCRRDGMSELDAIDCFSFNTAGTWVGDQTPLFLERPSW